MFPSRVFPPLSDVIGLRPNAYSRRTGWLDLPRGAFADVRYQTARMGRVWRKGTLLRSAALENAHFRPVTLLLSGPKNILSHLSHLSPPSHFGVVSLLG